MTIEDRMETWQRKVEGKQRFYNHERLFFVSVCLFVVSASYSSSMFLGDLISLWLESSYKRQFP